MGRVRVFRVFVSSTFSDMREERNALQARVFPKLQELCTQYGARFQAVDLRWGVTQGAAQSQQTMRICLEEIERCRRATARPNFIALLGDRYGWRPIPTEIPLDHYRLISHALQPGRHGRRRGSPLDEWYRRDDNAVPPVYVLRPRPRSVDRWQHAERELRRYLDEGTEALPDDERLKYVGSSTEQEIFRGALAPDGVPYQAFCFIRSIRGLSPNHARAGEFIDLAEDGGPDAEARERLERLKGRVSEHLQGNAFHYVTRWSGDGVSERYLSSLVRDVHRSLSSVIRLELDGAEPRDTGDEPTAHEDFGRARSFFQDGSPAFVGRRPALRAIDEYLRSGRSPVLVVRGESGIGKTSLMARAAHDAQTIPGALIVQRFIGATPRSTNVRGMLGSICDEIAETFGERPAPSGDYAALTRGFRKQLETARSDRPILIFVDALDQLREAGGPESVLWIPQTLPVGAKLVVSAVPGPTDDAFAQRNPDRQVLTLAPMPVSDGRRLLRLWLSQANRTLSESQRRTIIDRFQANGLPLYLRLAFEEARLWRHGDRRRLEPTVSGLIARLFRRLARPEEHGVVLVERVLANLVSSRSGLADDEMRDILSADREVLRDFRRRSPKSPRTGQVPDIVWSRLFLDLQPYLTQRSGDGTFLLAFYHRAFSEQVARRHRARREAARHHRRLARYFGDQPTYFSERAASPTPNLRKLAEVPYQLAKSENRAGLLALLLDFDFLEAKVLGFGPDALIQDLDRFPHVGADRGLPPRGAASITWIRDAVALSAHVLNREPQEIAGQLFGRLSPRHSRIVGRLLEDAGARPRQPRLRPLMPTLIGPGPLIRTLQGHTSWISCLAVSEDGRWLVSGSNDSSVRVWDLDTLSEWRMLLGHRQEVRSAAVAGEARVVMSGSFDRSIRIWDLVTGDLLRVIQRGAPVESIAMFPDGRRFVAAVGNRLEIRRLPDGTLEGRPKRGRSRFHAVAVTPDGERLVTMSDDQLLRVRTVGGDEPPETLRGYDFESSRVVPKPDGQTIAADWETYARPAVSPDGRLVLAPTREYTIRLRDLATKAEVGKLMGHRNSVTSVAVSSDGRLALSGAHDDTVRVWDLPAGKPRQTLRGHSDGIWDVTFARSDRLAVSASGDATIRLWDLARQMPERPPAHPTRITAVAASPSRFVSASEWDQTSTIWIWDRRGRPVRRIVTKESVTAASITPDSHWIVAAGMGISLWRFQGPHSERYLGGDRGSFHTLDALAVTPDGRYLIDAGWEGARLWDLSTLDLEGYRRLAQTAPPSDLDLYTSWLAVSPDGNRVIGQHRDGIRIIQIRRGLQARTLQEDATPIQRGIFLPDGQTILGQTESGQLKVWTLPTLKRIRTIDGDLGVPVGVTPDGRVVVSYSGAVVRCWDLGTERVLASFTGEGPIDACALSPDGTGLIVGEGTGRVHILRLELGRAGRPRGSPALPAPARWPGTAP